MARNLHLKIVVPALAVLVLALAGGTASADPDPECAKPTDDNHSAGPTLSDAAHCVHTVATITGKSGGPVVENKWELPDMDPTLPSFQYTDSDTGHEACIWNATNTQYINTPCIDDNGNDIPNKNTGEHGHFHHDADPCKQGDLGCQTVVTPNVDDKPEKRLVAIGAVVSDAAGGIGDIANVQAIVTHLGSCAAGAAGAAGELPCDGAGKKITEPTHPVQLLKQTCGALFGSAEGEQHGGSIIHAAVNTGGLQHGKLIQDDCLQEEWAFYHGGFLLNNDQPWGKYQVCVQAIDTNSNLGERCNTFLVQNVVAFKLDFDTVNFGAVTAGISKTVSPGNVTNTGNADACLSVLFGQMEGKVNQNFINDFGTELKGEILDAPANSSVQFTVPIESKGVNKLRFTIDPPAPLAPDTYQGRVDLAVKKCRSR